MKGIKLWMVVIILLCRMPAAYCLYQETGVDPTEKIAELSSQRQAIRKSFVEFQKQKALEKEKRKERLALTESRLQEIQSNSGKTIKQPQPEIQVKSEALKSGAKDKSVKIIYFLLLIMAMIGCVYRIYKIKKGTD